MSCCALIVAAGRGARLDAEAPKQFLPLAGRPLLAWTLEAFLGCEAIDAVVLVVAADQREQAAALIAAEGWSERALRICRGGAERSDSVYAGLCRLPAGAELVAVHDGARALVTPALIARTVAAAREHGAALPALPVADTIKEVADDGPTAVVGRTLRRARLRRAQTPQVFSVPALRRAYERYLALDAASRPPVTDDAQVIERHGDGLAVHLIDGDPTNIKITVAADLHLAGSLLARRAVADGGPALAQHAPELRTGIGYDVHRFGDEAGTLVLAGARLSHERTLEGHSDADVVAHAVGDALLGAASLGDLGHHFPAGDPRWAGADSLGLLQRISAMLAAAGYAVGNIDCTVVCERPRLAPHVPAMRRNLARAVGADLERVSVKATTTEGLGFAGRGEGIAAYATTLLTRR